MHVSSLFVLIPTNKNIPTLVDVASVPNSDVAYESHGLGLCSQQSAQHKEFLKALAHR